MRLIDSLEGPGKRIALAIALVVVPMAGAIGISLWFSRTLEEYGLKVANGGGPS